MLQESVFGMQFGIAFLLSLAFIRALNYSFITGTLFDSWKYLGIQREIYLFVIIFSEKFNLFFKIDSVIKFYP